MSEAATKKLKDSWGGALERMSAACRIAWDAWYSSNEAGSEWNRAIAFRAGWAARDAVHGETIDAYHRAADRIEQHSWDADGREVSDG